MQDLIQHLPAVIYEYAIHPDGKRCFNYISPNCQTILGVDHREIIKDENYLYSIIFEDDLQSLKDTSFKSENNSAEWNWQGRVRANGRIKWVEFRSNHDQ